MNEDAKHEIQIALDLLRKMCVENKVSMAVTKDTGELLFFDTATYLETKKFDGFKVNLQDLVN